MALQLPRLSLINAIVDPASGKPTTILQRWWQVFCEAIEANEASQDALISQLQAALQLAGGALVTTDAGGATAKSGQTTTSGLTVDSAAWVAGPPVALTAVGALMTSLVLTGSAPQSATSSGGPMDGEYRIQEVTGGEVTVFTGHFTVRTLTGGATIINLSDPVNNTVFVRSATGAVSYRMDLRKTAGAGTATGLSAYLFARRYT